jgi:hypothetical protein
MASEHKSQRYDLFAWLRLLRMGLTKVGFLLQVASGLLVVSIVALVVWFYRYRLATLAEGILRRVRQESHGLVSIEPLWNELVNFSGPAPAGSDSRTDSWIRGVPSGTL